MLNGRPTMCDHCGDIAVALTDWPDDITKSCKCWCHTRRKEISGGTKKKDKAKP